MPPLAREPRASAKVDTALPFSIPSTMPKPAPYSPLRKRWRKIVAQGHMQCSALPLRDSSDLRSSSQFRECLSLKLDLLLMDGIYNVESLDRFLIAGPVYKIEYDFTMIYAKLDEICHIL